MATYNVSVAPGYTLGPGLGFGVDADWLDTRTLNSVGNAGTWLASSPFGPDTFAFLRGAGFDVLDVKDNAVYQLGPNTFLVPFGKWVPTGHVTSDVRWTGLVYQPIGGGATPPGAPPVTPAPPVPGAAPPNAVQNLLTSDDVNDYLSGYATAEGGDPRKPGTFWYDEGYEEQKRGLPKANLVVGSVAPEGPKYANITASELAEYRTAYAAKTAGPGAGYWGRQGALEAQVGVPQLPLTVGQPPPPFPKPWIPTPGPQPGQPPLTSWPCVELLCTEFGFKVPYDVAAVVGQLAQNATSGLLPVLLGAGAQFRFLGDAPGDQTEGYRLSGPSGPIARKVARDVTAGKYGPIPLRYQLTAWVGTHMRDGSIKLLGRGELQSLGLYDQLLELYPPPPGAGF